MARWLRYVRDAPNDMSVVKTEPTAWQYRQLLGFVRRRVNSGQVAEDVTQEVFASMAETLARTAETAPRTLGWLYTVARRRIVDEARRHAPADTVPLELAPAPEAVGGEYGVVVARTLDAALAALTESQRSVVVLRLLRGESFAEIAQRLGVTAEACRMRFLRGLEQLREEFEKEGLTP
jgi:RNA polymerase sigma-70 factor, ECF subfamily